VIVADESPLAGLDASLFDVPGARRVAWTCRRGTPPRGSPFRFAAIHRAIRSPAELSLTEAPPCGSRLPMLASSHELGPRDSQRLAQLERAAVAMSTAFASPRTIQQQPANSSPRDVRVCRFDRVTVVKSVGELRQQAVTTAVSETVVTCLNPASFTGAPGAVVGETSSKRASACRADRGGGPTRGWGEAGQAVVES